MPTKAELEKFVETVRRDQSVNFPAVADAIGMRWRDIEPHIETDDWFAQELRAVLQELKYELFQKTYEVARSGKLPGMQNPELAYIKEMVRLIDSDQLIKKAKGETDKTPQEERMEAIMRLVNGDQSSDTQPME